MITEVKLVPLTVPADLLACAGQPSAPMIATQRDAARFIVDLAEAGADCRSKLARVRTLVENPPPE